MASQTLLQFIEAHYPTFTTKIALPQEKRARIIQLLRRAGRVDSALRFGRPFVRGEHSEIEKPSHEVRLEYAAALVFSGLESEGRELLKEIPDSFSPFVHLYRAFSLFPRWEYEAGRIELEKFLARVDRDDYFYNVGRLNLAASLVFTGRLDEAEENTTALLQSPTTPALLKSNTLELTAQIHLQRNALDQAQEVLTQALRESHDSQSAYRLYIEKWGFILQLKRHLQRNPKENFEEALRSHHAGFQEILRKALALRKFETVRDLHLQTALSDRAETPSKWTQHCLEALLMGTPWTGYRAHLMARSRWSGLESSESIPFTAGPLHACDRSIDDLDLKQKEFVLEVGSGIKKRERLLEILLSDFFSPWSVPRLFQELFPGRWFDPLSSRNLLHQSVFELRGYLQEEMKDSPFSVIWENEHVFISSSKPFALKISRSLRGRQAITEKKRSAESLADAKSQQVLFKLKEQFQERPFKKADARKALALPERTLERYLNLLESQGELASEGRARAKTYRLPSR